MLYSLLSYLFNDAKFTKHVSSLLIDKYKTLITKFLTLLLNSTPLQHFQFETTSDLKQLPLKVDSAPAHNPTWSSSTSSATFSSSPLLSSSIAMLSLLFHLQMPSSIKWMKSQLLPPSTRWVPPPSYNIYKSSNAEQRYITDVNCLPVTGQTTWSPAALGPIKSGINYLRTFNGGNGACGVSRNSCIRISCSQNAAIYWCNNVSTLISTDFWWCVRDLTDANVWQNTYDLRKACFLLADYAQALVDKCIITDDGFGDKTVGGQAWDNGNWNVYIKYETC